MADVPEIAQSAGKLLFRKFRGPGKRAMLRTFCEAGRIRDGHIAGDKAEDGILCYDKHPDEKVFFAGGVSRGICNPDECLSAGGDTGSRSRM